MTRKLTIKLFIVGFICQSMALIIGVQSGFLSEFQIFLATISVISSHLLLILISIYRINYKRKNNNDNSNITPAPFALINQYGILNLLTQYVHSSGLNNISNQKYIKEINLWIDVPKQWEKPKPKPKPIEIIRIQPQQIISVTENERVFINNEIVFIYDKDTGNITKQYIIER